MPKLTYTDYRPKADKEALIVECQEILDAYTKQGYRLTVRQLYYQLVAGDIIPNSVKSYNRLVSLITRARDGGYIDWNHIVDRNRPVHSYDHFTTPDKYLRSRANSYAVDYWLGQPTRVIVCVEKDALSEIVGQVANRWDCPWLANKGYLSASTSWHLGHNLCMKNTYGCERIVFLHLGDHDPSGIDMTRDIRDRINKYSARYGEYRNRDNPAIEVKRIALTMAQVREEQPPPNPAKETDSRYPKYVDEFGTDCWELDALNPKYLDDLIDAEIQLHIENRTLFNAQRTAEEDGIQQLKRASLPVQQVVSHGDCI